MFEQIILASYSFFGQGYIGEVLNYWQQMGVFSYVLPFLLIFSLVFVTLSNMNLFQSNKGVSSVIAICVSLLAMQFELVPLFFAEIFPRVGIGLSIILALLILLGLFIPSRGRGAAIVKYIFLAVGIVIFLVIMFQTAIPAGWNNFYYFFDSQTVGLAIIIILVIVGIATVLGRSPQRPNVRNFPTMLDPRDDGD